MDADNWTMSADFALSDGQNGSSSTSMLSFWMNGVLSSSLVIIGMLGNISVVISLHCCGGVEMRQRRRQAFYYYLICFAFWNTGLLFATVLFSCFPILLIYYKASNEVSEETEHVSSVLFLLGYWIGNCCITADVWLAVAVTVERYLAIARPLQSRLTSPRRRARLVCILLSVLVVFYNIPLAFELTFASVDHQPCFATFTDLRDNRYYQFWYRVMGNLMFVSLCPFLIILLLTVKIVLVVRESERSRARLRTPASSCGGGTISNSAAATVASSAAPSPRTSASLNPTTTAAAAASSGARPSGNRYVDVLLTMIAIKFLLFYTLPAVINIVELTADPATFVDPNSDAALALQFLVDLANLLVVLDGATNSFFYFSWRNRVRAFQLGVRRGDAAPGGAAFNCSSRYPIMAPNPAAAAAAAMASEIFSRRSVLEAIRYDWATRNGMRQQTHLRLPQHFDRSNYWVPLRNIDMISE